MRFLIPQLINSAEPLLLRDARKCRKDMKKSVQPRQEKAAEGHFGDHDKDKHKQERTKDTVEYLFFRMPHVENAC